MESRHTRAARHVIALSALLGKNVIAIIIEGNDGDVSVVTPNEVRRQVLDLLAHLDWRTAYREIADE